MEIFANNIYEYFFANYLTVVIFRRRAANCKNPNETKTKS